MVSLGRVDDFIDEIDGVAGIDCVIAALQKHINFLGFKYFALQVLRTINGPRPRGDITTFPKEWVRRYIDKGYVSHDMASLHAACTVSPFTWREAGNFEDFTADQKRVFYEASDFGLNSGGCVPLHGPGPIKALVSVASDLPMGEFEELFIDRRHELQLIVTYAYEKAFKLGYFSAEPVKLNLTPRETEIMTWTARGKTAPEIAKIAHISKDTVQLHIEKAGSKLRAARLWTHLSHQ